MGAPTALKYGQVGFGRWGLGMVKRIALTVGFTLVEMAIVLVVIGILLSGGLLTVAPVIQGSKIAETKQRLDRIEESLTLYVIRNGCLPCPADATLANDGNARGDAGTYTSQCLTQATASTVCSVVNGTGVLPWIALGLSQAEVTDGWGNMITYAVTPGLTVDTTDMVRTPPSTYPAGALFVSNADSTGVDAITTSAAYVLISHGTDMRGAYIPSGAQKAAPDAGNTVQIDNTQGAAAADQLCGAAGTPCHQDDIIDAVGNNHFDDIVRWRSAPMTIQLCGTNACGNPA